jgi:hydrogenase nickel incorporation protein HypA/HybF
MHELSIAQSLIEVATEALAQSQSGAVRVESVLVRLGVLCGVVPEALEFSYGLCVQGTALEGSRLVMEQQPAVVFCPQCQSNQTLSDWTRLRCPTCDTPATRLVHGRELELISMEVIDGDDPTLKPPTSLSDEPSSSDQPSPPDSGSAPGDSQGK